ncbi:MULTISPECIES: glutamine amidotransferase [unclassified Ruegeria]|uniref:glutamine amidotransferase n=1 Tax=unclassified Ruegeria TaxID=2625375 RepID=UPI00148976E5|nr:MULTISPECIES: glutamine amidotransferase [unclassified Ruegeria]NOC92932.1 glutamine amidotransferase [Ruegeria sp. HKCCD6604]
MCGIAGRILTAPGQVGADLVDLMDAQEHRGADSTGFAVYGPPRDTGYVLRGMGFDKSRQDADLNAFEAVLKDHSSGFLSDPKIVTDENRHYCFRAEISDPIDLQAWVRDADELTDRFEVQSCGRSLEIIKDIGGAEAVAEKHGVRDIIGTHGLGHARLATESSVLPNASHPFWARPFSDVAIVHNGQITDYFTWRDKLSRKGYRFLTENDSELIAVWVSDQMKAGLTMEQALKKSITSIDGVFTYMIATPDGIGFAKDRFAMKPLVVVNRNGDLAAATEEQAVRRVMAEECDVINYDGPSLTGIWGVGNRSLAA